MADGPNRKRPNEESITQPSKLQASERQYILNADGTVLLDHKGAPVTVDKFLGTRPLREVISQRAGPGGRKLDYMAGEVVTQTLNDAFGYDGWSMEVRDKTREESMKDDNGRYHVAYTATVRITLIRSGAFREDCGAGDAIDRSLGTASGHAIKGAITDAMKRAARHFGEKTGNALYHSGFNANNAPKNLKDAFEQFDVYRAKSRFGFEKDRLAALQNVGAVPENLTVKQDVKPMSDKPIVQTKPASNQAKAIPSNTFATQSQRPMTQPKPTQGAVNIAAEKTPHDAHKHTAAYQNVTQPAGAYITPHHGANNASAANKTNRVSTGSVDFLQFSATQVSKTAVNPVYSTDTASGSQTLVGKENSNPQQTPSGGLNLPQRPGTSRGHYSMSDGMLGLASSILAMNGQNGSSGTSMSQKAAVKNPYNALG